MRLKVKCMPTKNNFLPSCVGEVINLKIAVNNLWKIAFTKAIKSAKLCEVLDQVAPDTENCVSDKNKQETNRMSLKILCRVK